MHIFFRIQPVNYTGNSCKKNEKPVSRGYSARKKPLYHNCQLRAPDDQLLCTCDVKKASWYVDKGLGGKDIRNPFGGNDTCIVWVSNSVRYVEI